LDLETILLLVFALAAGVNLFFRGMYVFWIGGSLRRAKALRDDGVDHHRRWLVFRRKASLVLYGEAVAFGVASVAGCGTLPTRVPEVWLLLAGSVLAIVGFAVRLAAVRVVGVRGYYWYNFFCPDRELHYSPTGVYRYLKNPMYGLGYLHVIGIPLAFRSLGGLVLGAVDWILVWVFYYVFERAHTETAVVENGSGTLPRIADYAPQPPCSKLG
jgi:protein-S-isoprenylcysteine O-methyltransferase Ste14